MFRSPQQLRSGAKGKSIPLSQSADKPNVCRSLSTPPTPSSTKAMSPPADKTSIVDNASIERMVNKYLSSGAVLDELVSRLTEKLKTVIQDAVSTATAPILEEVKGLREEVGKLNAKVSTLERELADKTDDLEQYQRRNNLRVFGVEEKNGECTDDLVLRLCQQQLGLTLSESSFCRTHRVGKQPQPAADGSRRYRPIIVKFVSYRDRRLVFSAKKKLKGSGITIREDLTARRRDLYLRAADRFGQKNTWTQDGRVLFIDKRGQRGVATRPEDLN